VALDNGRGKIVQVDIWVDLDWCAKGFSTVKVCVHFKRENGKGKLYRTTDFQRVTRQLGLLYASKRYTFRPFLATGCLGITILRGDISDAFYRLCNVCRDMAHFLYGYSESSQRVPAEWYPKFKELYQRGYKVLAEAEGATRWPI